MVSIPFATSLMRCAICSTFILWQLNWSLNPFTYSTATTGGASSDRTRCSRTHSGLDSRAAWQRLRNSRTAALRWSLAAN